MYKICNPLRYPAQRAADVMCCLLRTWKGRCEAYALRQNLVHVLGFSTCCLA